MNNRIGRNDLLMGTAKLLARRSTCERGQVGVVISRDGRMLSSGYNGAPAGMPHCNHGRQFTVEKEAFTNGNGCTNAVHAEANAIAFAAKHGVSLDKSELHTTLSPCRFCAQLIVNVGVKSVLYLEEYRIFDGIDLLEAADVRVIHFQEF
jgi:dCMP deaminase